MMPLFRAVWISFRRGKGLLFSIVILLLIWWFFSMAKGMEGTLTINNREVPFGDDLRTGFALGLAIRGVTYFGMLFLLFHGTRLLLGDVEGGAAALDLTAPVGRGRYLLGRSLGLLSVLALFWIPSILVIAWGLGWRLPSSGVAFLSGVGLLLLGQLLLGGVILPLRLVGWGGWGPLIGIVIWFGSWTLSLDAVELYLFDVGSPRGDEAAWWYPFLEPYVTGEPAGWKASSLRLLSRVFPPIGNVQSVGLDLVLGRPVFPRLDWWAIPSALVWCALLWGACFRIFRRRDL